MKSTDCRKYLRGAMTASIVTWWAASMLMIFHGRTGWNDAGPLLAIPFVICAWGLYKTRSVRLLQSNTVVTYHNAIGASKISIGGTREIYDEAAKLAALATELVKSVNNEVVLRVPLPGVRIDITMEAKTSCGEAKGDPPSSQRGPDNPPDKEKPA